MPVKLLNRFLAGIFMPVINSFRILPAYTLTGNGVFSGVIAKENARKNANLSKMA